jgi:cobalamin-dependent methionine synthase I
MYQFLDISSVSANGIIMTKQGYRFTVNKKIIDLLKNAEYLLLMVVTIGLETEKAVKEKFQHGNHIRAMVLDAAGTVAVKTAGQWLNHFIEENNSREGLKFSRYFEPGSGDWDIREQKQIFEILKPERIGITLNPSFMMNPAKSLSWIRGSGHNLINSYRDEFSCQYCLLTNCPFRKN